MMLYFSQKQQTTKTPCKLRKAHTSQGIIITGFLREDRRKLVKDLPVMSTSVIYDTGTINREIIDILSKILAKDETIFEVLSRINRTFIYREQQAKLHTEQDPDQNKVQLQAYQQTITNWGYFK